MKRASDTPYNIRRLILVLGCLHDENGDIGYIAQS